MLEISSLSKAVDVVSHAELLKKIPFYEICGKLNWSSSLHTLFVDHRFFEFSICVSEAQPVFIGVHWQGSILGLVLFIIHFNVHILVLQFSKVSNFCHVCQCIITYIHYYMHYYLIRCMEWDAISVFAYLNIA